MIKIIFKIFILIAWVVAGQTPVLSQSDDDVEGFLKAGRQSYEKNDLAGAALEFENVLMIDQANFSARVWLAQIYADLKDMEKARKFLREAALQAPDHPKVIQLQKLIGESKENKPVKESDPVVHETMTLLGKDTRLRKFGLVIPESRIAGFDEEKKLLVFDDLVVEEKKPVEKEIDLSIFEENTESPILPALKAWENQGLSQGLDSYFELLLANPGLASQNDKGLVEKGRETYVPRLKNNDKDPEAMFYCGMLSFINGQYEEADLLLGAVRKDAGAHSGQIEKAYKVIDSWKEQEKQRLLAIKRAEEERIAAELAEKERQEKLKAKKEVWASLKTNKDKDEKSGEKGNAEALNLHEEGYELYKKGKLEEAIEKFEAAIAKDGNNGKFHYHLGLAWTDKGLAGESVAFDRAIDEFQKVISLMPDDKLAKDAQSMIRDIDSAKKSLGN